MKVAYPVIFTDVDTNILIEVPDLEILTEANEEGKPKGTLADAIMMARDAIGIACIEKEDKGDEIKEPSLLENIDITQSTFAGEGKNIISIVDVDLVEYKRKIDTKVVRKNVSLPSWLNYEADKAGINVSRVLQEALISVLGVSRRV